MGKQLSAQPSKADREGWLDAITRLMDDVVAWSEAQGWPVERGRKRVSEDAIEPYEAPTATIRLAGGQLHVEPVGLSVIGADGRVDFEAWPTLNRVKLLRRQGRWTVYTDSNVPLRQEWNKDAYVQLARDLMA
jgi:hypothetical protein